MADEELGTPTADPGQGDVNFSPLQPEPEPEAKGDVNALDLSDLYGLPPEQFQAAAQQRVTENQRKASARWTKKFQELADKSKEIDSARQAAAGIASYLKAESESDPRFFEMVTDRMKRYAETGRVAPAAGNGSSDVARFENVHNRQDLARHLEERDQRLMDKVVAAIRTEFVPVAQTFQNEQKKQELIKALAKQPPEIKAQGGSVLEFWNQHPGLTAQQAVMACLGAKMVERQQAMTNARFSEAMGLEQTMVKPKGYQSLDAALLESIQEVEAKRNAERI